MRGREAASRAAVATASPAPWAAPRGTGGRSRIPRDAGGLGPLDLGLSAGAALHLRHARLTRALARAQARTMRPDVAQSASLASTDFRWLAGRSDQTCIAVVCSPAVLLTVCCRLPFVIRRGGVSPGTLQSCPSLRAVGTRCNQSVCQVKPPVAVLDALQEMSQRVTRAARVRVHACTRARVHECTRVCVCLHARACVYAPYFIQLSDTVFHCSDMLCMSMRFLVRLSFS